MVESINEISAGRLKVIRQLESAFDSSPTLSDAITLESLWRNWKQEGWGRHIKSTRPDGESAPSDKEVDEKILKYSNYENSQVGY